MLRVKNKEETVKSAREKQLVMCKGIPVRLSADFSGEILQAGLNGGAQYKCGKKRIKNSNQEYQRGYHLELEERGEFPGGPLTRTRLSLPGPRFHPCWGTKILGATQHSTRPTHEPPYKKC